MCNIICIFTIMNLLQISKRKFIFSNFQIKLNLERKAILTIYFWGSFLVKILTKCTIYLAAINVFTI